MELQKLNSVFQPEVPIEQYESLIWTERYGPAGDFELVSSDISRCMQLMPLESYVTIKESTVPMIVESHKIVKEKNSVAKIEIRGRSFESVLERRGSVFSMPNGAARATASFNAVKTSDAAYLSLLYVLGGPAKSFSGGSMGAVSPIISSLDAIPEIDLVIPADYALTTAPAWSSSTNYTPGIHVSYVNGAVTQIYQSVSTNSNTSPPSNTANWKLLGDLRTIEIKAGNLYSTTVELVQANRHGIKAVRPSNGSAKTTVDIEIYNGADLTTTTVFDAKFDQFDDATYLLSAQGSTNIAYVYGGGTGASAGGTIVRKNTVGAEVSGLARRVLVVDEMSDATLNATAIRTSRGLVELYKNNAIAIFDGELAKQVADLYNKSVNAGGYSLGDIIQFNGEYGLSRKVRVVEFIRTSDATGESAYPAFEVIEE